MTAGSLERVIGNITSRARLVEGRRRQPKWNAEEDRFLREHLGWLEEKEIARRLGRTKIAVHLRWKRDMGLPAPSKNGKEITAHQAAKLLGIDSHKTAAWVDLGLIRGRRMPGGRVIRLIDRQVLRRWTLNPMNWVYFDPRKVPDPELRRMLKKQAKRWGDEWWTTIQVAEHHGVEVRMVSMHCAEGRLEGIHLPLTLGGRHKGERRWSNWRVRRSAATAYHFPRRGEELQRTLTKGGKEWIRKALRMGMNSTDIGATMKEPPKRVGYWIRKHFPKLAAPRGRAGWSKMRLDARGQKC